MVDYIHLDGFISNICSYTKVKPHCEYDACMIKCTILAKFCSYRFNYNIEFNEAFVVKLEINSIVLKVIPEGAVED